jgi:hypothetical protein
MSPSNLPILLIYFLISCSTITSIKNDDCRYRFIKESLVSKSLSDSKQILLVLKNNDSTGIILLYGNNMDAFDTISSLNNWGYNKLNRKVFRSLYENSPLEVNNRTFEYFNKNLMFIPRNDEIDKVASNGKDIFLDKYVSFGRIIDNVDNPFYVIYVLYQWNISVYYLNNDLVVDSYDCPSAAHR